ncbi:MAG: O-antigen ligase family protein [Anaerolineae bacterium]
MTEARAGLRHKPTSDVTSIRWTIGGAGLVGLAAFIAWTPLEAATALLAVGGLALAIAIRPVAGLLALALLLPYGRLAPLPLGSVDGVDLLVVAALAGWLARGVARRAIEMRLPPLTGLLCGFLWTLGLSLTAAESWREGVPELFKWAEYALLYLLATQMLRGRQVWWMVGALFLAGIGQVALGAYQFVGQVGPPAFLVGGRFMRAYGSFQQPNPYAGYLGYLAPVAASLALAALAQWWRTRRPRHLIAGVAGGGTALLLVAGVGMSWSRGGWLALGLALIIVVGLRTPRTALMTLSAMAAVAVILAMAGTAWLPAAIAGRVSGLGDYVAVPDPMRAEINDDNFAVLERVAHWQAGLAMFDDHPWLGVGIGNYAVAYERYALPHWYEPLGHAHNIYINFLAETGVIGAGMFVALWGGMWWTAWRRARATSGYRAALALGLMGTLTYLTAHNLFDNLFVQHMQLQLALLLACTIND